MMESIRNQAAAEQLHGWFHNVLRLTDKGFFSIVPEGPHRGAVVLDVLTRNARIVAESDIDSKGKLYSPLCFFLAAACRKLRASLGVGHWRAAVDNLIHLQEQTVSTRAESATVAAKSKPRTEAGWRSRLGGEEAVVDGACEPAATRSDIQMIEARP